MKKIVAFAGSTSSTSINKQLVSYASTLLDNTSFEVVDMRDYQAQLYSIDDEQNGFPENMVQLSEKLKTYDGYIVSLAEHNGSYAAAFKNTFDWLSRIDRVIFNKKPMLLMATSPGGRGGASVLASANASFPHMGADVVANFSLPGFFDNFKEGKIVDSELNETLKNAVQIFESKI
ncbi:NAD(P)H-dependent oxidoreductase [Flavobacteriaceae bacterium S356]|uniref:NAD(P)H-dependent oxidoreductase n=1 Tax=Asprobacillus argus TaxID=3076534 RepID=A0ABU3LGY0_9FLAO|nr:NAD(P)H-dependent oxidoreductase [Flavobacteriaceae bacterium S356]